MRARDHDGVSAYKKYKDQGHSETDYIIQRGDLIYMGVKDPRQYVRTSMQKACDRGIEKLAQAMKVYYIPVESYKTVLNAILFSLNDDQEKCKSIR